MSQPPRSRQITADQVRKLFSYDQETGALTRNAGSRRYVGKPAGFFDACGYRLVVCAGITVKVHRLAWLYVTGQHPIGEIDHINGKKADNRFSNLRDVPIAINRQNLRAGCGSVGMLGVSRSLSRFRATIKVDKVCRYLGTYATPEEAHAAYVEAKQRLHPGCTL